MRSSIRRKGGSMAAIDILFVSQLLAPRDTGDPSVPEMFSPGRTIHTCPEAR